MGKNSLIIDPDEVRRIGMIEYIKKYKTKMSKRQLYDLGVRYMYHNYMLNGHTHAVVVNKVLYELEDEE